jgi:hypothetical protein
MSKVTILRREMTVHFPQPRQAEEMVAVTFVTEALGVRTVALPVESYRPATVEELGVNLRYRMRPVDKAAADAEGKAIEHAIAAESAEPLDSYDVP